MKLNACIVQEPPIFFDKSATLERVEEIIKGTKGKGYDIIVFPESYIPGYPRGFDFGTRIGSRTAEGKSLYADFHQHSFEIDSPDLETLERAARNTKMYVVIGVSEKVRSNGSLYCTMLYISPYNGLIGYHRKIKPTGLERVIWAESDGRTLATFDTEVGRIGGLICWENYMPLARMSLYQKGVQIYIAPTADARDSWISSMQHIALEGRCYVLSSNQYFTKDMIPVQYLKYVQDEPHEMCRGGSVAVDPNGKIIAGPLFGQSGLLDVEIDLALIIKSKLDFDPSGHYNREDIFKFQVINQPTTIIDKNESLE